MDTQVDVIRKAGHKQVKGDKPKPVKEVFTASRKRIGREAEK